MAFTEKEMFKQWDLHFNHWWREEYSSGKYHRLQDVAGGRGYPFCGLPTFPLDSAQHDRNPLPIQRCKRCERIQRIKP